MSDRKEIIRNGNAVELADETCNIIAAETWIRLVKIRGEKKTRRLETVRWKALSAKVKK